MSDLTAFVAYPSEPPQLTSTIKSAANDVRASNPDVEITLWEENDIAGRFLVSPIFSQIDNADILLADITRPNFNVLFEVGFAIGKKKRVFLLRNMAIESDGELIREVGIFDTVGYKGYANSSELVRIVSAIEDTNPMIVDDSAPNRSAPLYLILPRKKTDADIRLVSRIKKARLQFRSFDPEEHGRLAAGEAIDQVAKSFGVVAILLSSNRVGAKVHNLRTSFVAGLAVGLGKPLLLLQDGEEPVPLDYRDLVKSFRFPDQIDQFVADFSTEVVAQLQSAATVVATHDGGLLSQLTLGASSAENELQELGQYYLETAEFRRASRGEARIVTGRKGTGKTALFLQLRNKFRQHRELVVLDLKPEGFQLMKFKERVLDYLEDGTREHTITAFWEYLLLLETCHKILQTDESVYLRDARLFEPYRRLADEYISDEYISEGDFSERMVSLTQRIADDFDESYKGSSVRTSLSSGEITEVIYRHDVASLRKDLVKYLSLKGGLWILFDNLDKGWPAYGIGPEDVLTLRCLLDAMSKLERQLRKRNVPFYGVVFIRNDVYEMLVDSTPDRGKNGQIALDWTDPELLRELLRRRILHCGGIEGDPAFEEVWPRICDSHIRGEETSQYLIDRSLMRPRGLIDLLRFCRSRAVNLGHKRITIEDIESGEEAYSSELLNNIGLEIRDVFPNAGDVLYEFLESPVEMRYEEVLSKLDQTIGGESAEKVLEVLLWYGVLGLVRDGNVTTFIHDVKYDSRRLAHLIRKHGGGKARLRINPAFWAALEVKE